MDVAAANMRNIMYSEEAVSFGSGIGVLVRV
jgi:hypothetical protein